MTDTGPSWVFQGENFSGVANDGQYTAISDTTATAVTPVMAATAHSADFLMIDDILVSVGAAGSIALTEETSGKKVGVTLQFPGAGTFQITPRNFLKTQTAGKRIIATPSGSLTVAILINGHYVKK